MCCDFVFLFSLKRENNVNKNFIILFYEVSSQSIYFFVSVSYDVMLVNVLSNKKEMMFITTLNTTASPVLSRNSGLVEFI